MKSPELNDHKNVVKLEFPSSRFARLVFAAMFKSRAFDFASTERFVGGRKLTVERLNLLLLG